MRLKVALGFNLKEHIPMVLGAAACRHFHPFAWKICSQLISVFSILCSAKAHCYASAITVLRLKSMPG